MHVCDACGWESVKWMGQCRECGAWGTMSEFRQAAARPSSSPIQPAIPVTEVDLDSSLAYPSGVTEFDRVLGKGITPGGVVLLAGDPGVGKSTLLLDIAARFSRMAEATGRGPVLYVTGEETASQVRIRAERIGALSPHLLLAAEANFENVAEHIRQHRPSLLIVDSVQTLHLPGVEGVPGGVTQIRAVTAGVIKAAKEQNVPAILVGHVTKDGGLAGPRSLEHLVDVVCHFEGDPHTGLRLLRALKNRYGSTDEIGCFQLTDLGIEEVPDPSGLFLSRATLGSPGSAVTVTLEGQRALTTEIQALSQKGNGGNGRRVVSGLSQPRVAMVLAVLEAKTGIATREEDIYVSTVGGARTVEPATDLAVILAVASASRNKALPAHTVTFGEVGLTGDVRATRGLERRLQEASRLGFTRAIIPADSAGLPRTPAGMEVTLVSTVAEALAAALPLS